MRGQIRCATDERVEDMTATRLVGLFIVLRQAVLLIAIVVYVDLPSKALHCTYTEQ